MGSEDSLLLKQISEGNKQSFERLYNLLAPKLMALLTLMLRDRHLAEDVLQETMVIAWHQSHTFDENKASATTWIYTIARHKALDRLRQKHRYDDVLLDHSHLSDSDFEPSDFDYQSGLMTDRLKKCFDEIGQEAAACIKLAYFRGFTHREIARIKENSVNTVKSLIRRGLAKLRECVSK